MPPIHAGRCLYNRQAIAGWATALSAGPTNESGQILSFEVLSNTNPALFSSGPAVDASGGLSFSLAANANGSTTIGLAIKDNGSTANGDVDTYTTQTFNITVTPVYYIYLPLLKR